MIDWEAQWAQFAPGFKDGYLHINNLKLKPGPGFGDLSHPTTQLMCEGLDPLVIGKDVVDVGCGSGILGLVALSLKVKSLLGIDIDEGALEHAKANAKLNNFTARFEKSSEQITFPKRGVILLNMISSEQKRALQMMPKLMEMKGELLVSGLLESQQEAMKLFYESLGWTINEVKQKGDWIAMLLKKCSDKL